jgi:cyclopropane fatty-acyl-phospholipid synthase-like methyltransferase
LGRLFTALHHDRKKNARAIAHHYEVSNDFYALWLDPAMVYSCVYFPSASEGLEAAQQAKLDHVLSKIMLQPGERLLDIGCGWGALAMRAAQKYGAKVVGVTLSKNQYELARLRVAQAGLADRVDIRLQDYRDLGPQDGRFDKITSIGLFEHVGLKHLPEYFGTIYALLKGTGLQGWQQRRTQPHTQVAWLYVPARLKCTGPPSARNKAPSRIYGTDERRGNWGLGIGDSGLVHWRQRLYLIAKPAVNLSKPGCVKLIGL